MFPTVMGSELFRERVRDLRAVAAGDGPRGPRRRRWRSALGTALISAGVRLRDGAVPRSELRTARAP